MRPEELLQFAPEDIALFQKFTDAVWDRMSQYGGGVFKRTVIKAVQKPETRENGLRAMGMLTVQSLMWFANEGHPDALAVISLLKKRGVVDNAEEK